MKGIDIMPRYIDAEKLEKDGWSASRIYQQDATTMVYETKKMTEFPTADVVERREGNWIKENIVLTSNPPQYRWHCSVCGKLMHWFNDSVLTSFCPNCGAEMDK